MSKTEDKVLHNICADVERIICKDMSLASYHINGERGIAAAKLFQRVAQPVINSVAVPIIRDLNNYNFTEH